MTKKIKKGFTLIELALAITFITVLLLTIGWLTIHITTVYEKGLTIKAVSSTAKEIIDDVSRAISTSPARTTDSLCAEVYNPTSQQKAYDDCKKDNARKLSYQQRYATVKIKGEEKQVPINGVFCTGRYSYIWNTAYVLNKIDYETVAQPATFNGNNNFRLLKVSDFNRYLCTQHMVDTAYLYDSSSTYKHTSNQVLTTTGNTEIGVSTIDLLRSSENDLALYDLTLYAPTVHEITSSGYYSGSFILATLRGGIDINSTGNFCSDPPEESLSTDFTYCAVNKFNFAMRSSGEKTRND